MASAVTSVQVTQPCFQEHLQTAASQICQARPAPPSSSISEIQSPPRLGCSMCKSELTGTVLPNPPNPSQQVTVGDLSPMCHARVTDCVLVPSTEDGIGAMAIGAMMKSHCVLVPSTSREEHE